MTKTLGTDVFSQAPEMHYGHPVRNSKQGSAQDRSRGVGEDYQRTLVQSAGQDSAQGRFFKVPSILGDGV